VQKYVDEWIDTKDIAYYRGITLLPEKWEKRVENGGHYFYKVLIHLLFETNKF